MKHKNIIKLVCGLLLLIVAMLVFRTCSKVYLAVSESGISNIAEKDNVNIFLDKYKSNLNHLMTYTSKVRPSTSVFNFNEKYDVVVFKLPLSKRDRFNLSEIISLKLQKSNRSSGAYHVLNQRNFKLANRYEKQPEILKIFLKFNGIKLKTIVSNDTVVSYSGNFEDFSLEYKLDGICDIYAEKGSEGAIDPFKTDIPVNLLFYRKGNFIYFVILSTLDPNGNLKDDVLYNLVVEK